MAKKNPVKTAILGLGRIGWNHHVRHIRAHKDLQITAVSDPLPERRLEAEKELGCKSYSTLASLLRNSDAELVVVATRSVDHARHALQCLDMGRHVLVEKPAATTLRDMDAMLRTARSKKRVLTVHQNNRFSDLVLYFKQVIDSGMLGEVFEIKVTSHYYQLRNDWQTLKKNGGGHLLNHGAHWVDAAMFLLGSPVKEIWGDMKHLVAGGDADDYFKVILRDTTGRIADIEASMAADYRGEMFMLMGTRGTLASSGPYDEKRVTIRTFKPRKDPRKAQVVNTAAPGRAYGQVVEKVKLKEKVLKKIPAAKVDFYGNLARAIRNGEKLIITPESVREQMRVLMEVKNQTRKKKGDLYR